MTAPYTSVETTLRGTTFRSRLEARWSLFFDAMDILWRYEPEKFRLDSGTYIPDFRLQWPSGLALWAECKPTEKVLTPRDRARYIDFARNRILLLLDGPPEPRAYRKADALKSPGGIVLLREGPAFVMDPSGAPNDMKDVVQASELARKAKFVTRRA